MTTKRSKIDWLNLTLEFLVVILGILLAFQLNKCSSDKKQRKNIGIHIEQIVKETEVNKVGLENAISYAEANLVRLDTIIHLVGVKGDKRRINILALELLNIGGVYIRKNAYLTLTETGDVRFMEDFHERQKIINLYEYYKWVESFNEISMNLFTQDYYPYLSKNFDLVQASPQSNEIYYSKYFKNILGAYYRTSQNRLAKYKECLVEVNQYLQDKT